MIGVSSTTAIGVSFGLLFSNSNTGKKVIEIKVYALSKKGSASVRITFSPRPNSVVSSAPVYMLNNIM